MFMLLLVFILSIIIIFLWNKDTPKPIFGVYRQPGRWYYLKYLVIRFSLAWRRYKRCKTQRYSTGYKEIASNEDLECVQKLSSLPQAFDAIFFIAASQDGYSVAVGTERRHHIIINSPFYIVIPGKGVLCSKKIPDTVLFGAEEDQYGAEGLDIRLVEPMKKWKISFSGIMKYYDEPSKTSNVTFDAVWTSNIKHFNFDTDLDDHLIASSLALEEWSREYFETLQTQHQTHYEQMGMMNANITVDGEKFEVKNMGSFRDHSFGFERNWDLMHRYCFFMFFLEDGTMGSVGSVCQPKTCSGFNVGYICLPQGKVHSINWLDFKLYQNGENGTPPTDHAFQFKAGNTLYTVQVNVEKEVVHYVGWKWQAKMVERFVKYDVNGIKGRGLSEFNYHNPEGRPESFSKNDPEWFKSIKK